MKRSCQSFITGSRQRNAHTPEISRYPPGWQQKYCAPYSGSAVFLFMVANDKLEFAGRARGPMRFGSVGNPVSTGNPRNGTGQVSVLNDKLVFV